MVRVKQFADDLGITKNQAQSLINKGRSRKDGGSQILENVMKPKGYKDGGAKPKKKPNKNYSNDAQSSVVSNKEKLKRIGIDLDRPKDATRGFDMDPKSPYMKALNKARKESGQEAAEKNKKAGGGLPDLTGDGKVTRADVLKGRGVPGFSRGGGMAIQGLGFKGVR